MSKKPAYFEIFTASFGALLLEISYTRIFSFKVFYYFTYMILGVGLLGLGAGGIAVSISETLRRARAERVLSGSSLAAATSVLVGYFVIAPLRVDIAQHPADPAEIAKLLVVSLLLTTSFFFVGIVLSTILSRDPEHAGALYGLDLAGAATGAAVAVPLVSVFSPPRTVLIAALFLAFSGLRAARGFRPLLGASATLVVALAVLVGGSDLLPDPEVAAGKHFEEFRESKMVRFSAWSSVFRIDVVDHPMFAGEQFVVFHDGLPGSGMRKFDGTFESFRYLDHDTRALPFAALPPHPKVLVIGAAGGHELVASLYFGAEHVTGVELNPVTYSLLTRVYADVTGHLADNPKVTLVNGDGRWFLKQSKDKYDLVWFVAPDSYAAMNAATSGAFVLSESYLYTAEMVAESVRHLTDTGVVCAQFGELSFDTKPNRTTRYLMTARAAFEDEGIPDFPRHVLIAAGTGFAPFKDLAILLSRKPFAQGQIDGFVTKSKDVLGGTVVFAPDRPSDATPPTLAVTLPKDELARYIATYPYQVTPVRDDAPFFWHFARFSDALRRALPQAGMVDQEDTIAEQTTLAFLGLSILLAGLVLVLPMVRMRSVFVSLPHKLASGTYFAALGLGFMFVEVALLQTLTLFLGYPTYSLSVTLSSLLVFSGLGSALSARWTVDRSRLSLTALFALFLCVVTLRTLGSSLIDHWVGRPLPLRIFLTVLLVAPIGLCLGTFMPVGLRTVAGLTDRSREYVAWAWAVNGFFSVIASVLATILAMILGFKALMLVALAVYAVGVFALSRIPTGANATTSVAT